MSISVDDLVASLSSNHIGQEAIDLATLQAQLAQTLFAQPQYSPTNTIRHNVSRDASYTQPCNTPTATASLSFDHYMEARRQRSGSIASMRQRTIDEERPSESDDMDEDERMVEDLLVPSSPLTPNYATPYHSAFHPSSFSKTSAGMPHSPPADSPISSFASTDPFYLAQLQAPAPAPQSFFAQSGRPAQHSPFILAHQSAQAPQHRREVSKYAMPAHSGVHPMFATTSAMFER